MGLIQHHAIIATISDDKVFNELVDWLKGNFEERYYIVQSESVTNRYRTIVIPPDGSKEGWIASAEGDERRESVKERLAEGYWDWVEVSYGEVGAGVDATNCENQYGFN